MNRQSIAAMLEDEPDVVADDIFGDEKSFSTQQRPAKKRWNFSLVATSVPILLLAGHVALSTINLVYSQDRNRTFFRTQVSSYSLLLKHQDCHKEV